jgi:Formyl transferase
MPDMQKTRRVDLFLGSELGLWVLGQVCPDDVNQVVTLDLAIGETSRRLGFRTQLGNANEIELEAGHVGLSVHYPKVFKPEMIAKYQKLYNLHPGYLPWGKGYYPVFWALWEQTPAGATLHEVTAGIDEGPVVSQIRVDHSPHDTGGDLYQRVRAAEERLFLDYWPRLLNEQDVRAQAQNATEGSHKFKKDFFALKQNPPLETMTGLEVIQLIRCLTFPGYTGLEISLGAHRYELRLARIPSEGTD